MGNTASCSPSIICGREFKVLFSDGRVEEYKWPIKAAELMLENPRQFVCDLTDLKVGRRIPGLAADEDLEPRRFYFLLPMEMIYSVLTNEDMVSLSNKASKAMKQGGSKNIGRIFPVFSEFCMFPSEVKPVNDLVIRYSDSNERFSRQGSWRPSLDTIVETPQRI
ncbi:DUF4228 domain protein [Tasmannia lanceolata]|uniref:DUF4228 domain protein n=1 Tax=Tasmannia lanceolata TaxID=3420 RepID=UPI0040647200